MIRKVVAAAASILLWIASTSAQETPLLPSLVVQNISYPNGKWNNDGKPNEGLNDQVR